MKLAEQIRGAGFRPVEGGKLRVDRTEETPFLVSDPTELEVVFSDGASARLVVLHAAEGTSEIRISLGVGAQLELAQIFTADAFAELFLAQAAESACRITAAQLTGAVARYRIDLNGAGSGNAFRGFFLSGGGEICTTEIRTVHNVSDCRSESVVKGVAGGSSRGEFRGTVYVARDAQRTDARQQSRNVLLSETARILAEPQLEIYADDVKCSHGATVGLLDSEAILYMRQRGLSESQARRLQIEGFLGDVAAHCGIGELDVWLMDAVTDKMEAIR